MQEVCKVADLTLVVVVLAVLAGRYLGKEVKVGSGDEDDMG